MALSGGMVSSCHWGCGAVAARALRGRGGEGEGGGWAQQDPLRGRRKLARRRKSSGRGRRLHGPGEPQWRNRAQRRLRKRLSPAEGSRRRNSAQSPHPLRLMYPSTERCVRRAQGFRALCARSLASDATRGATEDRRDYFFRLITFANLFLPPLFFFFAFCHIMRLGATDVTSVGALGPTHVLPGARDTDGEGSADCCQNGERVLRICGVSWE